MTATVSPLDHIAPWVVCDMLADGLDVWAAGEVLVVNGPLVARDKWAGVLNVWKPLLVAYLREEVTAGEG